MKRPLSRQFYRLTLGAKINLTVLVTCWVALAIASTIHIAQEVEDYLPRVEAEHRKLAQVVAANVSAAVVFDDERAMQENIDAFALVPDVDAAVIRDLHGTVIATYAARNVRPGARSISITEPIRVNTERVGSITLTLGLDTLRDEIRSYLSAAAIALLISLAPAMAMVRFIKPAILHPLNRLRETMDRITLNQDFGARVREGLNDEFGILAERFNAMLDEIERRDRSLATAAGEMAAARDAAEAANATKTRFIANMSHELRTPLNAIIGYTEMVLEDLEGTGHDAQLADLGRIRGAGLHLLGLINDVLDVAKIESGKLELNIRAADVGEVIREAVESVRPTALANGNALECTVDDAVGVMPVDEMRFRQCLLNLLSNACKFTEQGTIRLAARMDPTHMIPGLVVEVADSGIGIAPDRLETLFEPFVQVDSSMTRSHGGSGLGLAITRDLVEMMGGAVTVASEVGAGSVFTIALPSGAGQSQPQSHHQSGPGADPPPAPDPEDTCDVLVIEDVEDSAALLTRWLGSEGYVPAVRSTGAEGIAAARALCPDLVILDVDLPDVPGWEVLEDLAPEIGGRALPVVLVTVADDRTRALAAGASDLVTKPVQKARLLEIVAAHVRPPAAKVVLDLPEPAAAPLRAAIAAAGHSVLAPGAPGAAGADIVVAAPGSPGLPGPAASAGSPGSPPADGRGRPCAGKVILWYGAGAPHAHNPGNAPFRVATSLTELLVAIRRHMLEREPADA